MKHHRWNQFPLKVELLLKSEVSFSAVYQKLTNFKKIQIASYFFVSSEERNTQVITLTQSTAVLGSSNENLNDNVKN